MLATAATALLIGCVYASATPLEGPDGQPGWFWIWCKTEKRNCERKSEEVCPHGYVLADVNENAGASFSAYKSAYVTPAYRGYMVIKCRGTAADVADGGDDGG